MTSTLACPRLLELPLSVSRPSKVPEKALRTSGAQTKQSIGMIYREMCVVAECTLRRSSGAEMGTNTNRDWKTRVVRGGFPDRRFDIEFWQEQGDEAIFRAAWEMVVMAEEFKHGRQPRFQRTVTRVQRKAG